MITLNSLLYGLLAGLITFKVILLAVAAVLIVHLSGTHSSDAPPRTGTGQASADWTFTSDPRLDEHGTTHMAQPIRRAASSGENGSICSPLVAYHSGPARMPGWSVCPLLRSPSWRVFG